MVIAFDTRIIMKWPKSKSQENLGTANRQRFLRWEGAKNLKIGAKIVTQKSPIIKSLAAHKTAQNDVKSKNFNYKNR